MLNKYLNAGIGLAATLALATLGAGGAEAANLIDNGGFETGDFSSWSASGTLEVVDTTIFGGNGSFSANFNGGDEIPDAILSQSFTTVSGQSYQLQFIYGTFSAQFSGTSQSIFVELDGLGGNGSLLSTSVSDLGSDPTTFNTFQFDFIADSATTTLRLSDDPANPTISVDFVVDDISVISTTTPIPEPMTLLGASAAIAFGTGFKRRKKQG